MLTYKQLHQILFDHAVVPWKRKWWEDRDENALAAAQEIATTAYRAGQEEMRGRAARICHDMIDNSDYGLDRERTVSKLEWVIGNLPIHSGQSWTEPGLDLAAETPVQKGQQTTKQGDRK